MNDLGEVDTMTLFNCLKNDEVKRFAVKNKNGGQVESSTKNVQNENENIGFKCLHYSVTKTNGAVEVTVVKKNKAAEYTFGVRTKDMTATTPQYYINDDKIITMKANEQEYKFEVAIVDV